MKKVFIICGVRNASEAYRIKLENYVLDLEKNGINVHLPHRDTDQNARVIDINQANANAIRQADEVHIFYTGSSQGTHFDMGVAFANEKKLVVVENEPYSHPRCYPKMLEDWAGRF